MHASSPAYSFLVLLAVCCNSTTKPLTLSRQREGGGLVSLPPNAAQVGNVRRAGEHGVGEQPQLVALGLHRFHQPARLDAICAAANVQQFTQYFCKTQVLLGGYGRFPSPWQQTKISIAQDIKSGQGDAFLQQYKKQ